MIMIVVIGGIKGGTGKTTLCTNLAVARATGKRILLVDADEQKSAATWVEHRENLQIPTNWTTIQLSGKSIRQQLLNLKPLYDEILVDTGGRDTTSQRASLSVANIFITPFRPRSLDIWTLGILRDMILEILCINGEMRTIAVLNCADSKGADNQDTINFIKEHKDIEISPFVIGQRKAFSHAADNGLGIIELTKPDKKALSEFNGFCDYVFDVKKK